MCEGIQDIQLPVASAEGVQGKGKQVHGGAAKGGRGHGKEQAETGIGPAVPETWKGWAIVDLPLPVQLSYAP